MSCDNRLFDLQHRCLHVIVQALGREDEANQSFNKALQLVQDIQHRNQGFPAVLAKCEGLLSFLKSRQG